MTDGALWQRQITEALEEIQPVRYVETDAIFNGRAQKMMVLVDTRHGFFDLLHEHCRSVPRLADISFASATNTAMAVMEDNIDPRQADWQSFGFRVLEGVTTAQLQEVEMFIRAKAAEVLGCSVTFWERPHHSYDVTTIRFQAKQDEDDDLPPAMTMEEYAIYDIARN